MDKATSHFDLRLFLQLVNHLTYAVQDYRKTKPNSFHKSHRISLQSIIDLKDAIENWRCNVYAKATSTSVEHSANSGTETPFLPKFQLRIIVIALWFVCNLHLRVFFVDFVSGKIFRQKFG